MFQSEEDPFSYCIFINTNRRKCAHLKEYNHQNQVNVIFMHVKKAHSFNNMDF